MELPKIETWLDLVATALVALAVLYTVIGLFGFARAIRISAILIVTSLALFSDSFGTYFAAIFIVAAAVTELEFLEKLAAIIRGSKEYFDYKKSQVPVAEAKAKAGADAAAVIGEPPAEPFAAEAKPAPVDQKPDAGVDAASVIDERPSEPIAAESKPAPVDQRPDQDLNATPPRHLLPSGDAAGVGYVIEQLALTYFEGRLGVPIQRNLRFSTQRAEVEFDGVVERGMGRSDTLIEVKLASERRLEETALRGAQDFMRRMETFKEITGRRTTGIIVVVVPDKSRIGKMAAHVKSLIQAMSHTLQFELIDFKDIGYSNV